MGTNFDEKVQEQIHRLSHKSYPVIEDEVTQKRINWLIQHHPDIPSPLSPRQAFELLFFEYMGLSEKDIPVIEETDTEIVWLSQNPCPTLEACKALHLDTREVCRLAYEKSTQAFLSQLDPRLRFSRSYQEIRPYTSYCKEWIMRVDFEARIPLAREETRSPLQERNQRNGLAIDPQ